MQKLIILLNGTPFGYEDFQVGEIGKLVAAHPRMLPMSLGMNFCSACNLFYQVVKCKKCGEMCVDRRNTAAYVLLCCNMLGKLSTGEQWVELIKKFKVFLIVS